MLLIADKLKIWQMPSDTFNKRRRENDLPLLLKFFHETLPCFEEWLSTFKITDELIISHDHTGDFFVGKEEMKFVKTVEKWDNTEPLQVIDQVEIDRIKKVFLDRLDYEEYASFIPYFHWLNTAKDIQYFTLPKDVNKRSVKTFEYNSRSSYPLSDSSILIQPTLMSGFEVLSLGGVQINGQMLAGKNLDFLGLDKLVICYNIGVSRFDKIQFSSLHDVTFQDIGKKGVFEGGVGAFLKIIGSNVDNIKIYNSNIQDIHFYDCGQVNFSEIIKGKLRKFTFSNTTPSIDQVKDSEFLDLNIIDIEENKQMSLSKFYEKVTLSYSQIGDYHNAGKMYYKKEFHKMMSYFFVDFLFNQKQSIRRLYDGTITLKDFIKQFYSSIRTLKLKNIFLNLYEGITRIFLWLIRGFGEKPMRTIFSIIVSITIFSLFAYDFVFEALVLGDNLKNSLLSFTGQKDNMNLHEAMFAVWGLLCFGFLVSGLTNKKNY